MRVSLQKSFRFDAAHWLPSMPEGHKCRRLHGHSFVIDVAVVVDVAGSQSVAPDFVAGAGSSRHFLEQSPIVAEETMAVLWGAARRCRLGPGTTTT